MAGRHVPAIEELGKEVEEKGEARAERLNRVKVGQVVAPALPSH